MAMYMLNNADMNKYFNLYSTAEAIYELYKRLYELECSGNKDSDEYKHTLKNLKELIETEKKLYENSVLPAELCKAFMALTQQVKLPKNYPSNLECIVCLNNNEIVARRVMTRLQYNLMNNADAMVQLMPNGIREVLSSLGAQDIEKILKERVPSSTKLQQAMDKDTYSIFLSCVEEYIKTPSLSTLKETLMSVKYLTSFVCPNMEEITIERNFIIEDSVFINSRAVADIHQIDNEVYRAMKNLYGIEIANEQLNGLLGINDREYTDINKNVQAILRQSILRAIFFQISDDVVENIEDEFNRRTSTIEYTSSNKTSKISVAIIKEAFDKRPKDKSKHLVISFNPNSKF